MNKVKAQGAIEYLLIIGAAVIIAVIVIALMMSLSGEGTGAVEEAGVQTTYSELELFKISQLTGLQAGQEINPAEEEELALDLIALFHMNASPDDSISGTLGDIVGLVVEVDGLWGTSAYEFNGDNVNETYIEVIGMPETYKINQKVTYSVWFKPYSLDNRRILSFIAAYGGTIATGDVGENPDSGMHQRDSIMVMPDGSVNSTTGSYSCALEDNYEWNSFDSTGKVSVNNWNQVVSTIDYETGEIKLYVNGELSGQDSYSKECTNDNVIMWVGRRKSSGNNFYGLIDEVAVWDRVLSNKEIENLFLKGAAVLN